MKTTTMTTTKEEIKLKTELYGFQAQAADKLMPLLVGALYMEMGTGKTRTALEIIYRRMIAGKVKRVLWLCPCSVKENLRQDIAKHSEGILAKTAIVGIESLSQSSRIYLSTLSYVARGYASNTNMLIVDESNLVKNFFAKRTKRIIELGKLCKYRMILNGTPVSRNEADLFAQWYILCPDILGFQSYWGFANKHLEFDELHKGKVKRVVNVDSLTNKIAPYSFMVKKADVLRLPDKCYNSCRFSLTPGQKCHYQKVAAEFLSTLINADDEAAIYRTFTALQQVTAGRLIISDASERIVHEPFFKNPMDNPRLSALMDWLISSEGEKTIIWCKYQHEIDTVYEAISQKYGESVVRTFTGKDNLKKREQAIVDFRDGDVVYLVANKACAGYGLNLQFCHRAIYYDNDWDWATRAQSEDRIHRIGQEHEIIITDIYCDFGIDKRIISCLGRKERMVDSFKSSIREKNAYYWLTGLDEMKDVPKKKGKKEVKKQ